MNFLSVKEKLKSNIVSLRHNVASSINTNGVPASFTLPVTALKSVAPALAVSVSRTAPPAVFEELTKAAEDVEQCLEDVVAPLDAMSKNSQRAVAALSALYDSESALENNIRAISRANDSLTLLLAQLCRVGGARGVEVVEEVSEPVAERAI